MTLTLQTTTDKCKPADAAIDGRRQTVAYWLVLAIACLGLYFFRLGDAGLIDPGDGYFSEAAREMIEYGNFVTPHLNYQIYFSKPILIYWLIIPAYKLLGVTAFAARLSSALLASALVFSTGFCLSRLVCARAGFLAAISLAAAPLMVTFGRMSMTDMPFTSFIGMAMCASALTLIGNAGERRFWPFIYISLGLAVLAKGPAALVTYGLGLSGYLLITCRNPKQWWQAIMRLRALPGIAIIAAVAVSWYVAVGLETKWLWPQVFLFYENMGRFAGHTNHRQPYPWFYLPVLAYGLFPWVCLLPPALLESVRAGRDLFKSSSSIGDTQGTDVELSAAERVRRAQVLFACWALSIIVFFSISITKLQTYILPAFPALCMIIAITAEGWLQQAAAGPSASSRYLKNAAAALAGIGYVLAVLALVSGVAFVCPQVLGHARWAQKAQAFISETEGWIKIAVPLVCLLSGAAYVTCQKLIARQKIFAGLLALCAGSTLLSTVGAPAAFETAFRLRQNDLDLVAQSLKQTNGPVAIFRDFKPSIFGIIQRPVDAFFSPDQVRFDPGATAFGADQSQYIITGPEGKLALLQAYPGKLLVYCEHGKWCALESKDLRVQRLPTLEQTFTQHLVLSTGEFSWGTLPYAGGTKPQRTNPAK